MKTEECSQCKFYKKIRYTLEELDKRVKHIKPRPGGIPQIKGIDIYGETLPKDEAIGGDHIIYIDFNKRYDLDARIKSLEIKWQEEMKDFSLEEQHTNPYIQKKKREKEEKVKSLDANRTRAGVLVADVKGHDDSGSFIVGMLHQSFLTGALYEMKLYGKITTNLFEKINTRFYQSSSVDDFLTMIYGEIFENGKFLFISAGHPDPLVFSNESNQFMEIPKDMIVRYPPIGVLPSRKDIDATKHKSIIGYKKEYQVSNIELIGEGDILLLYSDGLTDLENNKNQFFFPDRLKKILEEKKSLPAKAICAAIREEIYKFNSDRQDDITYVIIKKFTPETL